MGAAALRFTFEVPGDQAAQINRALRRFASGVRRLFTEAPGGQIADDFRRIQSGQFSSEGARGSGGWAPLTDATLARKAARGFGGRGILVETGSLRSSLIATGGDHIDVRKPLELRLGTRVPYARFHQSGFRTRWPPRSSRTTQVPSRKPIELTEADKRRWTRHIQRFLVKRAQDLGLTGG